MHPEHAGLDQLPNIGEVSAGWLRDAGVRTVEDLETIGAVEAWRRAKAAYPQEVTINLLYALQAALLGVPWTHLPAELKQKLRAEASEGRA